MSEAIIVAIIAAGSSVLVQVLINHQNNQKHSIEQARRDQKLDDRLDHIEVKLEEHNGYAKMFSEMSTAITRLQQDMAWIKEKTK